MMQKAYNANKAYKARMIFSFTLSALFTFPLWADSGKTTAEFLKLGAGARAGALAGAYSAVADEPSGLYWNPASLAQMETNRAATLMHAVYIESTFFDYLAYGQRLSDHGVLGASLQYFSAGKITKIDETGSDAGSFTPNDMALSVGYACKHDMLRGFAAGAALKYVQSKIIDSAQTAAIDLGVLSPSYLDDKLKLALSFSNLGGKMKFTKDKESLPLVLRLGSAYKIKDSWLAALDIEYPPDADASFALATEYLYPLANSRGLAARAGINTRTMGDVDGFTGFTYGVGFRDPKFSADYSIEPLGDLGLTHRLSLTLRF